MNDERTTNVKHPNARPSLRDAIDAKCRECIYDPMAGGGWRQQVAECCSANCPLHAVRPVPKGAGE